MSSSENMSVQVDIRAHDEASPVVAAFAKQMKRLQDQMRRLASPIPAGKDGSSFLDGMSRKAKALQGDYARLNETIKAGILDQTRLQDRAHGSRQRQETQARSARRGSVVEAERLETASLGRLVNLRTRMIRQRASEEARTEASRAKSMKALFSFQAAMSRQRAQEETREESRRTKAVRDRFSFESAMGRQRAREEKELARDVDAHRRGIGAGLSRAGDRGGRALSGALSGATIATAATAALTTSAVRSLIREGVSLDTAENRARTHIFNEPGMQDQASALAREWRSSWAVPKGIQLGINPADLYAGAVETAQAGVPVEMVRQVTELSAQIAKYLDVPLQGVTEHLGRAVAQSSELRTNPAKVRSLFNVAAGLAGQTAANREQMIAFTEKGLGAGRLLGISDAQSLAFGAALGETGAQGAQAGRGFAHWVERLTRLKGHEKDLRHHRGPLSSEDQLFRELPRLLGYGSFSDVENKIKAKPDTEFFAFIKSFKKINDPAKRMQALHTVFGDEFGVFLNTIVNNPETLDRASRVAAQLQRQTAENDEISKGWANWSTSFAFLLDQINATAKAFKAELGDELKDYASVFRDYVAGFSSNITSSKDLFKSILKGLVEGFLGRPGDFRQLMRETFGAPGDISLGNGDGLFKFAKGFAEGLKTVWIQLKGVLAATGRNVGDPQALGKLAGELIGLSVALTLLRPVVGVVSVLKDAVLAVAALGGALLASSRMFAAIGAGVARFGAPFAARFGVVGAGLAAAFWPTVILSLIAGLGAYRGELATMLLKATKALGSAISDAVLAAFNDATASLRDGSWKRGVVEFLDPGLADRIFGPRGARPEPTPGSGPTRRELRPNPLLPPPGHGARSFWETGPLLHRSSLAGDDAVVVRYQQASLDALHQIRDRIEPANENFGGMFHRASLAGGVGRRYAGQVEAMGARLHLASINPMASGGPAGGGSGSGGGSSSGGGSGGSKSLYNSRPGDRLPGGGTSGPVTRNYPAGMADAINTSARDLGIDPKELAAAISYETGGTFDPWKRGPTTKWGTHRGLIQWGEPQARKYGVGPNTSVGDQMKAVTRYLRDHGVRPGHGLDHIYRAINAGNANAPMSMRDRNGSQAYHIARIRSQHMGAANRVLSGSTGNMGSGGQENVGGGAPGPGATINGAPVAGDMTGDQVNALARSVRTVNKQCVSLAKAVVGSTDSVTSWRRGEAAMAGTLRPGTPIATFMDRYRNLSDRYAGGGLGSGGTRRDHAAVFESYIRDQKGKIIGMNVSEQWNKLKGINREQYFFGEDGGRHTTHNGSSYYAIKDARGLYLGGTRNPMNVPRPASPALPTPVTPADAARGAPRQTPADAARSVPMPAPNTARGGQMVQNGGRSGNPVTINVNGYNKNPQELAQDVHRHITQAQNWRTMDVEHEAA